MPKSAVNNMKEDTRPETDTESDVLNFRSEKDVMIRLVQELESAQLIKLAGSHANKELVPETA
jgi:hypothetical protein